MSVQFHVWTDFVLFVDCMSRCRVCDADLFVSVERRIQSGENEPHQKKIWWKSREFVRFKGDREFALIALRLFISFVALWPPYRRRLPFATQKWKFFSSKCVCQNEKCVECWAWWWCQCAKHQALNAIAFVGYRISLFSHPRNHSLLLCCPKNDVCLHGFRNADVSE